MGNRIELPAEDVLPPGPHRRLVTELHLLYRSAGRPGLRMLSAEIRADNSLPATLSHEAIRQILRGLGGIPRWPTLRSLVWVLARHAQPRRSPDSEVERFLHLWEQAGSTPSVPAVVPKVQTRALPYTPEAVHFRLVSIMAEALDAIADEAIPQSVRAFARYAPDKHATLSTAVLLAWLRDHDDFRAAVVNWCRERRPDVLDVTGSDPAGAAAAALLLDDDAAAYYLAVTTRQERRRNLLTASTADLDTLLKPTGAHLVVAGDELYPDLPTEDRTDKLIHGLAALAMRTNGEVTVVFNGRELWQMPKAVPRGVRALWSDPSARVEDVITAIVQGEPLSRHVVVATANVGEIDLDGRPLASFIDLRALASLLEEILRRSHEADVGWSVDG